MRMVGYSLSLRPRRCVKSIDDGRVADVVARHRDSTRCCGATPSSARSPDHQARRPVGALLIDQAVIAGVAGVYRNELLGTGSTHSGPAADRGRNSTRPG